MFCTFIVIRSVHCEMQAPNASIWSVGLVEVDAGCLWVDITYFVKDGWHYWIFLKLGFSN